MGGKDRAMTPPQYFLASVASCTAAFVAKYCNVAGLNCEGMTVSIEYEKIEQPLRLGNIKMKVKLPHCENKEKLPAIQRSAEHCVIHETLNMYEGIKTEIILG